MTQGRPQGNTPDAPHARGRLFLPWVTTTFGGIGPATIWHFIDSIYATSSSLANLNRTSSHAVAIRKAHFLPNHPLYPTHRHCYHQITCGASPLRHRRPDDLARLVAHHLGSEAGLDASISANLYS